MLWVRAARSGTWTIRGAQTGGGRDGLNCWDLDGDGDFDVGSEDFDGDGEPGAGDCRGRPGSTGPEGPEGPEGDEGPEGPEGSEGTGGGSSGFAEVTQVREESPDRTSGGETVSVRCPSDTQLIGGGWQVFGDQEGIVVEVNRPSLGGSEWVTSVSDDGVGEWSLEVVALCAE